MSMERKIASELVKIAKSIIADYTTDKKEIEKYLQEHVGKNVLVSSSTVKIRPIDYDDFEGKLSFKNKKYTVSDNGKKLIEFESGDVEQIEDDEIILK